MTNLIQVEILPDGIAKECNPLGDEPIKFSGFTMAKIGIPTYEWKQWQIAESQRRVFKINPKVITVIDRWGNYVQAFDTYEVGSIHTAGIVNEDKLEIVIK